MSTLNIQSFFDKDTSTFTYLLSDSSSKQAAVIDTVLNYDPSIGNTSTVSADEVIAAIKKQKLSLKWILETHIHADHLTASSYIKEKLGGKICVSKNIQEILPFWSNLFNFTFSASEFDNFLKDGEIIQLGEINITVIDTPGHTPTCVTYLVEDVAFVGDLIFMPDVGTARSDFPGGCAKTLYHSIRKIYKLPAKTKIYTCHDYPPQGRSLSSVVPVEYQRGNNILMNDNTTEREFINCRNKKDKTLPTPRLLLPSIQINLRAGKLNQSENNGTSYIKIPVNKL